MAIVQTKRIGYFKISWIKGHLDKPENKHYLDIGLFTAKEVQYHIEVDKLASSKANNWTIPKKLIEASCYRMQLSALVQSMYIDIWRVAMQELDVLSEELINSIFQ